MTLTERPTRNGFLSSSLGSSAMRTGTRWTILIQLPEAFCGGSTRANTGEDSGPVADALIARILKENGAT